MEHAGIHQTEKSPAHGPQDANNDSSIQMDLLQTSLSAAPSLTSVSSESSSHSAPSPPVQSSVYTAPTPTSESSPSCTQVVHYFDRNGALRSGRFVQWVEEGEQKGKVVVSDYEGNQIIPDKIRNIE